MPFIICILLLFSSSLVASPCSEGIMHTSSVSDYTPLSVNITKQDESSFAASDGSIGLFVSNGASPYSYLWSTSATTPTISGLSGGTYTVTVTDSLLYTVVRSVDIAPYIQMSISATLLNASFPSISDGYIDITVSNGRPPYSYQWSNGATSQDIFNIPAGTYSVTVTDSTLNTEYYTAEIKNTNSPFMLTYLKKDASSYSSADGYIDLIITGAHPPYSYQWSNGDTTQDIEDLAVGLYIVTITDSIMQTITLSIPILSLSEPLILTYTEQEVSAQGSNDGYIDITISGGTQPYTFTWSNGAITEDITNLDVGLYSVTVIDFRDQIITESIWLNYIDTSQYLISGRVYARGVPVVSGRVIAYRKEADGSFTTAASTPIRVDGSYSVSNLQYASYILYAIPDPTLYSMFNPTYYVNKIEWSGANVYNLKGRAFEVDISLAELPQVSKGAYSLSGFVLYEDTTNYIPDIYDTAWFYSATTAHDNGFNPARNVSIKLKLGNNIIAWQLSDINGYFIFDSLPVGTYTLVVEESGMSIASDPMIISKAPIDSVYIIIRSDDIIIDYPNEPLNSYIQIYPNPTAGIFQIDLKHVKETSIRLTLYNSIGEIYYNQMLTKDYGNTKATIDISHFPTGIYLGVAEYDQTIARFKMLKK